MKILILDDLPERHERFRLILKDHNVTHVWTYDDAVKAFQEEKFDMACLDHDLGDLSWNTDNSVIIDSPNFKLTYTPSVIYDMYKTHCLTGDDLCYWLSKNPVHCPAKILIHSWNPEGAARMSSRLKDIPGIEVNVKPFKASND
jgi:CheY-like chemotaxis protein